MTTTVLTILHRLTAGLGRVLIAIGALAVAFAAFQFWGTGLAEARAQEDLEDQFSTRLAAVQDGTGPDSGDDAEPPSSPGSVTSTEPVTPSGTAAAAPMLDLHDIPEIGEAAGRLVIPAIGVDKTYLRGVGRDELRKGPGHYPLTAFPGQPGNAAIAGHRTTYGAPFFDLDKLVPGDEIIVETLQGRFTYLVDGHRPNEGGGPALGHFIVAPTATWVLENHGDSRLTLTACHPKRSAAQRIVVTATLRTRPATPIEADPAVEPDGQPTERVDRTVGDHDGSPAVDELVVDHARSLEESLGWQPEHWPPTALWGALSALTAMLGWHLGRRWRRIPAYLAAAGPFCGCLFVCFTHLDKLLPAI